MLRGSPRRRTRADQALGFEAGGPGQDRGLAVVVHLAEDAPRLHGVAACQGGEQTSMRLERALVVALLVVIDRAQTADELREEVRDDLVEKIAGGLAQSSACGQISYESQRQAMIEELRDESRLSEEYGAPPISERTLAALGQVPRHEFVPDSQKRYA